MWLDTHSPLKPWQMNQNRRQVNAQLQLYSTSWNLRLNNHGKPYLVTGEASEQWKTFNHTHRATLSINDRAYGANDLPKHSQNLVSISIIHHQNRRLIALLEGINTVQTPLNATLWKSRYISIFISERWIHQKPNWSTVDTSFQLSTKSSHICMPCLLPNVTT